MFRYLKCGQGADAAAMADGKVRATVEGFLAERT